MFIFSQFSGSMLSGFAFNNSAESINKEGPLTCKKKFLDRALQNKHTQSSMQRFFFNFNSLFTFPQSIHSAQPCLLAERPKVSIESRLVRSAT